MSSTMWPWISLVLMGAFHGLNPAMGWLFAVAIGFQERSLRAVISALGPITIGHALAIALVAVPVGLAGLYVPRDALLILTGLALLGFAAAKVATRFRHPRWVGMRVRPHELAFWSFIMATAHGAGLMLAPVIVSARSRDSGAKSKVFDHAAHVAATVHSTGHVHTVTTSSSALTPALWAVFVHSGAMLTVAALLAVIVYRFVGVERLAKVWINLDLLWVAVFTLVGALTTGLGLWNLTRT